MARVTGKHGVETGMETGKKWKSNFGMGCSPKRDCTRVCPSRTNKLMDKSNYFFECVAT